MGRFETALHWTLNWEGGYSNNPHDKGGETNKGITKSVYDGYRTSHKLQIRSVREIETAEVQAIYTRFWDASKAGAFDLPLAMTLFDTAVNFGPGRAIQFLNKTICKASSTKVTAQTLRCIKALAENKAEQAVVARKICQLRIEYRHARVKADRTQERFLKGWLRRDTSLRVEIDRLTSSV
jgi:lysozyme family protein